MPTDGPIGAGMLMRVTHLERPDELPVTPDYLARRRVGAIVLVYDWHQDDVWWVVQADGVAAYHVTELRGLD